MDIAKQQVFVDPARVASNASPDAEDIDVRGLVMMLWRQKFVVIAAMLIGLSLAALAISFIKPLYTARALVLIESNVSQGYSKEFQALFTSLKRDYSLTLTEIEVIRSRSLARKVVMKHRLMTDPELNPRFRDLSSDGESEGSQEFKSLSVYTNEMDSLPAGITEREVSDVISRFLDRLIVRSIPGSNAIQVEYMSHDPERAAFIANAVVDGYIEQRLEAKFASTKKLTDWLDKRLSELRDHVRVTETEVISYKQKNNIIQGTRAAVSTEQLSQLSHQLAGAKSRRAVAEAKLEQISKVSNNMSKMETVPDVFNSDLVRKMKLNVSAQESNLKELETRYGPKHPKIIEAKSEVVSSKASLKSEILKTVESIKNEVSLAQTQVETLENSLTETSGEGFDEGEAMIHLRELEQEAASTRLIYDTFLETYKKSNDQDELQEAEARIISYAVIPGDPSYPNNLLIISLSAAISLFVGLAIAILLEKLDNTFRSSFQLESATGIACFGMVPSIKAKDQKEAARFVLSKPSSTLSESVKTLRTALNLRHLNGGKAKVVTMTSSFPGEGKTTLSVWLGRLAAKSGEKILLIDADLRRPNVHRLVSAGGEGTLVDYLTGQKELDQVIQKDEASGLHVIKGAAVPNSALDLINGQKMKKLIESLRQVYDLVILDSPACLAVSDSSVLATLSDVTLYNIAWDQTPREVVASGVKQFTDMGYDRLAFVLTNVDVKRHARYGYGDTVYYYGRYKEYYTN